MIDEQEAAGAGVDAEAEQADSGSAAAVINKMRTQDKAGGAGEKIVGAAIGGAGIPGEATDPVGIRKESGGNIDIILGACGSIEGGDEIRAGVSAGFGEIHGGGAKINSGVIRFSIVATVFGDAGEQNAGVRIIAEAGTDLDIVIAAIGARSDREFVNGKCCRDCDRSGGVAGVVLNDIDIRGGDAADRLRERDRKPSPRQSKEANREVGYGRAAGRQRPPRGVSSQETKTDLQFFLNEFTGNKCGKMPLLRAANYR